MPLTKNNSEFNSVKRFEEGRSRRVFDIRTADECFSYYYHSQLKEQWKVCLSTIDQHRSKVHRNKSARGNLCCEFNLFDWKEVEGYRAVGMWRDACDKSSHRCLNEEKGQVSFFTTIMQRCIGLGWAMNFCWKTMSNNMKMQQILQIEVLATSSCLRKWRNSSLVFDWRTTIKCSLFSNKPLTLWRKKILEDWFIPMCADNDDTLQWLSLPIPVLFYSTVILLSLPLAYINKCRMYIRCTLEMWSS